MLVLAGLLLLFSFTIGFQGLAVQFAQNAVANWNHDSAVRWLALADRLGTGNADAAMCRARIARRSGQLEQMQEFLNQAKENGSDSDRIRRELLLAKAQIGQLPEAEAQLGEWLRQSDVDSRDICSSLANGLAIVGRIDQSAGVLHAWANDFPNDPRPHFRLGRLSEHEQDYDKAEAHYQKALTLDDDYLPACYSLGRMLTNRRRIPEALEYYRRCLQAPNPAAAKIGMATCLKAAGEIDEAKALLEETLQQKEKVVADSYRLFEEMFDPTTATAELGKIESDLGNYERATELLEQALATNPRDNVIRYAYATALRGLGKSEQSQAEFERVRLAREELAKATLLVERVAKNPEDVEARIQLGKIHLEYDSEQRGLYWLGTVFTFDPQNVETHQLLSDFFDARNQPGDAELAAEHRKFITE